MKNYSPKSLNKAFSIIFLIIFSFSLAAPVQAVQNQGDSYIVFGQNLNQVKMAVLDAGGVVVEDLVSIQGVTAMLTPNEVTLLRNSEFVQSVFPNGTVELVTDEDWNEEGGMENQSPSSDYPDATGADTLWDQGITGQGISVAVIDTGIGKHRGLLRGIDPEGKTRVVGYVDLVSKKKYPTDPNGHGTHVAGVIANSQLGEDGEFNGMAPGVDLVGIRVLDAKGKGNYSTVIKGIDWAIARKDKYNIRVINLSIVASVQSPYWADPLNKAIMRAWSEGIVVVTAAGNTGSGAMTVGVPGNNPYIITVGAFTDNFTPNDWSDDYMAPFSSAGPTADGFVKPDVVAPGAHMVSTMLPNSTLAKTHQANKISNQYFSMAGTSQSAAVVSGVAALMLSINPGLSPDEVKYRIMYTAFPWTNADTGDALYSVWQQGSGRINAPDAVLADVSGIANEGMDIQADMNGDQHYEGYSYYDETDGNFKLHGDDGQSGSFGLWSGSFGLWSGSFGLWSGSFGLWSGSFGLWSGSFGLWSGSFGLWSGSFGLWSGGYGTWAGGPAAWTGSVPWAGTAYANPAFAARFADGTAEVSNTATASITNWVKEPKK